MGFELCLYLGLTTDSSQGSQSWWVSETHVWCWRLELVSQLPGKCFNLSLACWSYTSSKEQLSHGALDWVSFSLIDSGVSFISLLIVQMLPNQAPLVQVKYGGFPRILGMQIILFPYLF